MLGRLRGSVSCFSPQSMTYGSHKVIISYHCCWSMSNLWRDKHKNERKDFCAWGLRVHLCLKYIRTVCAIPPLALLYFFLPTGAAVPCQISMLQKVKCSVNKINCNSLIPFFPEVPWERAWLASIELKQDISSWLYWAHCGEKKKAPNEFLEGTGELRAC